LGSVKVGPDKMALIQSGKECSRSVVGEKGGRIEAARRRRTRVADPTEAHQMAGRTAAAVRAACLKRDQPCMSGDAKADVDCL
jgi:hypothetical protein